MPKSYPKLCPLSRYSHPPVKHILITYTIERALFILLVSSNDTLMNLLIINEIIIRLGSHRSDSLINSLDNSISDDQYITAFKLK